MLFLDTDSVQIAARVATTTENQDARVCAHVQLLCPEIAIRIKTTMIRHIRRANLFLVPIVGILVSAVAGVVWDVAVRLGCGRTCPWVLIYSGGYASPIIVATCGSLLALGIWTMRARTVHGCLIAATLIGAFVGLILPSMVVLRSSGRTFLMNECGTLLGAIAGIWVAVTVELLAPKQPSSSCRWHINLAILFKFVALISLTLAVIRMVVDWMSIGQISDFVGWKSWND